MQAQPPTSPPQPTEPVPIARVNTGMRVIDAAGTDLGAVSAVEMAGTETQLDLPQQEADRLTDSGYLKVDGGLLARDLYVDGSQVGEVAEGSSEAAGVVTLRVLKDDLTRAG